MAAKTLRMGEDDARHVYLVRAMESGDEGATILTREDRAQADMEAARIGSGESEAAYLASRANFAAIRLHTRHPAIRTALAATLFPGWAYSILPLIAFALGLASNELASGSRLELLALPLLGLVAWNVVAYIAMGSRVLTRPRTRALPDWIVRPGIWWAQRGVLHSGETSTALARFAADWAKASGRLNVKRGAIVLHTGAAMFALGIVVGIFLRALTVEYRAGWESTFLGPDAVQALLSWVLGPASLATGIGIPDVAGIASLRWDADGGGGVNAGPWIILYTATLVGFVAIPRLFFAGWNALGVARLKRRIAVPGREDFYTRRLLRARDGGGGELRITPYAYTPDAKTQATLSDMLRAALGEAVQVRFDDPVPYGNEDSWVTGVALSDETDLHIALFSLSATPERENHGWFADSLRVRMARERPGQRLVAMIDEGPYRAHFAGQSGLDERIAGRKEGWMALLRQLGISAIALDITAAHRPEDVQRLEAIMTGEAMRQAGAA